MAVKVEETKKRIDMYRPDYEYMSNSELMAEGRKVSQLSNWDSTKDIKLLTIDTILRERGVIK